MRLENAQLRVNSFAIEKLSVEARAANSSAEMRIKRVGVKL